MALAQTNGAAAPADDKQARRKRFEDIFPVIADEVLAYVDKVGVPQEAKDWYKKSLFYNSVGGKLNRGMSVVDSLEILKGEPLGQDEYFRAAVLGWCIELLQAYFLVSDDMMDQSITRRGQPCWYRLEHVGTIAVNDSFMIEAAIYFLLRKHFRSESYYVYLLEHFHETTFQTTIGQLLDLLTAPENVVDLSKFSLEKHHLIVVYKTAFYSFYLPVALAMRMAGITDEALYEQALDILIPLGEYFQVQDDYLDCYGAPEVIGKIGTDILDNKCSWNINVALKHATPEQRKILDDNYGRKEAECEARVKAVFSSPQVDLPTRFASYEKESYERICALIDAVPEVGDKGVGLKRGVFSVFLNKVYKRSK